jgi:hypothetical protein
MRNPTHGLGTAYAKGQAGEEVLTMAQRSRTAELRAQLATPDGALELLRERVVKAVAVCEFAEDWLRQQADQGKGPQLFTHHLMSRYLAAAGHATRSLALYYKLASSPGDGVSAAQVLESLNNGNSE